MEKKIGKRKAFVSLFEEKGDPVKVNNEYDAEAQMSKLSIDYSDDPTFVETETGGWGDTDTDTD